MATKFSMDVKNKNPGVKKLYGSFDATGTPTTNITNCTVSKSANGLFNIKMNYTYKSYLSVFAIPTGFTANNIYTCIKNVSPGLFQAAFAEGGILADPLGIFLDIAIQDTSLPIKGDN